MRSMASWGNDLYTGETSIPFVRKRKLWFIIAIVLVLISIASPFVRGVQFSIEFTGGSQFTISGVSSQDQDIATATVNQVEPDAEARVITVGDSDIRVQTSQLTTDQTQQLTTLLADAYGVDVKEVTSSFIGPTWGQDVTRQSLWGLGVFLALTFIILAIYFRTWKMSVAAIIGLIDVLVITIGVYALAGFEISPAAVIGFLTILGYSLYDTTVVFDKIRENTQAGAMGDRTFGDAVNLGVNQTLVRSINTSIVAALPVAAILFIGVIWFGAETLSDISLSIFVGILVATYSTLFVSAPLYAWMREREPAIVQHDRRVREARGAAVTA
ncbi:MAG: protein translocase subunit SecF [Microbacterium sp.]